MPDELAGENVVVRPLASADEPALRAILDAPVVARWWQPRERGPGMDEKARALAAFHR